MSFRVFQGNVLSLNGWRMCNEDECVWRVVPGSNDVRIEVRKGIPETILVRFLERFNQVIEPLRDNDTACWTLGNSVATSQHPAGVAVDCNWELHPFHAYGTYGDRLPALRHLLDVEFRGCVGWGGDWGGNPQDEMHFEIAFREGYLADPNNNDSFVLAVDQRLIDLAAEIQASQPPPPATPPAAQVLADATGLDLGRATEILPTVVSGLQASECASVNRIAMWLAQCGEESAGFSTTEEFASGAEYEGRDDLGNTQPGDGVRFKGRTWIQITGRAHYQEFSAWAFGKGLISSATQFVDNPSSLGDLPWAGIGAAWYWTVSRPDINALSDAGDVVTVTHRINGGEHGLADRQSRYDRAHALGDQLLALTTGAPPAPPTQGEGFLMALSDAEQHEVLDLLRWLAAPGTGEFRKKFASRSAVREPNEGIVDSITGMELNTDGNVDFMATLERAKLNYPPAIERLKRVAAGTEPGRTAYDALLAQAMLAAPKAIAAAVVNVAPAAVTPMAAPADNSLALANAYAENARLREENARLQAAVSTPSAPVVSAPAPAVIEPLMTSGDHAGKVIDSVEDWTQHILAMDTPQRAAFITSMKALELPNSSQP